MSDAAGVSAALRMTLANLAAADAAASHCLTLAADAADALAGDAETKPQAVASISREFADTVHTLGALLHDEVDKSGGPVSIAAAHVHLASDGKTYAHPQPQAGSAAAGPG